MTEQRTSKEVIEHLDSLFSGDTESVEVRASEWRIVKASIDAWRIMAQGRAKVIKDLEGDLQVARLQRDAKRTSEPPSAPYGIPEVLAYLKERAEWLRREWRNGGNFAHLSPREDECRYIAKCIEDTHQRLSETKSAPPAENARFGAEAERRAMASMTMNQCDGCRRGLGYNSHGHHVGSDGIVVMACTKDRYAVETEGCRHVWVRAGGVDQCAHCLKIEQP